MEIMTRETENDSTWNEIAPLLDEAIVSLNEADRSAVLLRFFERKSFKEVALSLGSSEAAAKKRVARAVEKLRGSFARHNVAITSIALFAMLPSKSVAAAPPDLITATTASALKGATLATSTLGLLKGTLDLITWAKLKTTAAWSAIVLLTAGTTSVVVTEITKSGSGSTSVPSTVIVSQQKALPKSITVTNVARFHWSMVESADYVEYIANLKAINCPWETIKDIIIADVNGLYARRLAALRMRQADTKYWLASDQRQQEDLTHRKEADNLQREKRELLRRLLGADFMDALDAVWGVNDYWQAMMDFLPREKRGEVSEIYIHYSDKEQEIRVKSRGILDPDILLDMKKVFAERRLQLEKLLTPQELLDFELRFSNSAEYVRLNTPGFSPTEDDYRKVVLARKELDDRFGPYGGAIDSEDKATKAERDALKGQLDQQLRGQFGDEKYALYERSQDQVFKTALMFAGEHDWPADIATKIYDLKRQAFAAGDQIRHDASIPLEERQGLLNQISSETRKAVSEILPQYKADEYLQWSDWWFKNLSALK
jgi:hypothetical protein